MPFIDPDNQQASGFIDPDAQPEATGLNAIVEHPYAKFGAGAIRGAAGIGATILAPFESALEGSGQSGAQAARERRMRAIDEQIRAAGLDPEAFAFKTGKLGSEIAGTAGVGPATPAASLAGRMVQGAVTGGAATAAIEPEAAGTGAGFGAAIPVIGKFARPVAKAAGNLYDLISGNLSKVRAGRLMRDVAGPEEAALRQAWANAPADLTAAQAAAEVPRFEVQSLGEIARRGDPTAYGLKLRAQQEANQQAMQQMAKGGSSEDAALYRDFFSKASAAELVPIRDSILNKLRQTGLTLDELLPQLSQKEAAYIAALQNQGRMATEAAQATTAPTPLRATRPQTIPGEPSPAGSNVVSGQPATGQLPAGNYPLDPRVDIPQGVSGFRVGNEQAGIPRAPVRYTPNVDRAAEFSSAADELGGIAGGLRSEADALRKQISELPSAFTAAPVRQAVSRMANEVGGTRRLVATKIAKELELAGDDPVKLAEVRKLGVNQLIGDLVDSGNLAKDDAAAALVEVKKVIDKQLGPEFVNKYLEPFSKKLEYRASLELADKLRKLQQDSPKKFMAVMRGDDPKLVEKYGNWDTIKEALGQRRYDKMVGIAKGMERDIEMAKQANEGADNLAAIVNKQKFGVRAPNFISHKATITNAVLDKIEASMNEEVKALISQAMKSGATANDLMAMLPASERNKAMQWIANGGAERLAARTIPVAVSQ